MRTGRMGSLLFVAVTFLLALAPVPSQAITSTPVATPAVPPILVNSIDDNGPGTLRRAIVEANERPGRQTIAFGIAAGFDESGQFSIVVQSPLPPITDAVTIDGTSQPGSSPDLFPRIKLDGSSIGATCSGVESGAYRDSPGLDLIMLASTGADASGTVVRGLAFSHFCEAIAVTAQVAHPQSSCEGSDNRIAGVTISNNHFNDNLGGNAAVDLCNVEGSVLRDNVFANNSDHIEITRSRDVLVSGNTGSGAQDAVELIDAHFITIQANVFSDGQRGGIVEGFGSSNNTILNNVITNMPASGMVVGTGDRVSGNTITGSGWYGIEVRGASNVTLAENQITGNQLGGIAVYAGALRFLADCDLDPSGSPVDCDVVSPLFEGDAHNNVLASNVISGNGGPGIIAGGSFVDSAGETRTTAGTVFAGNIISGNSGPSIIESDTMGSLYFDVAEPYLGAFGEVVIVVS